MLVQVTAVGKLVSVPLWVLLKQLLDLLHLVDAPCLLVFIQPAWWQRAAANYIDIKPIMFRVTQSRARRTAYELTRCVPPLQPGKYLGRTLQYQKAATVHVNLEDEETKSACMGDVYVKKRRQNNVMG